jgi:ankyrin repeat protein
MIGALSVAVMGAAIVQGAQRTPQELAKELVYATMQGDISLLRSLLAAGGAVNTRDVTGATLLTLAVLHGHPEVALFLLENGADMASTRTGNMSLFHDAASSTDPKVAAALRVVADFAQQKGIKLAVVNDERSGGDRALIIAIKNKNEPIIKELLRVPGIAVNSGDVKRVTPVMWAVQLGLVEVIKDLLAAGADLTKKDARKYTAFDYAAGLSDAEKKVIQPLLWRQSTSKLLQQQTGGGQVLAQ